MWNLKYDTDDLIYEIERRSRTHGTDCWLPLGMGNGGRMEGEVGVSRCKLFYTEWMDNKVLLYSTGHDAGKP